MDRSRFNRADYTSPRHDKAPSDTPLQEIVSVSQDEPTYAAPETAHILENPEPEVALQEPTEFIPIPNPVTFEPAVNKKQSYKDKLFSLGRPSKKLLLISVPVGAVIILTIGLISFQLLKTPKPSLSNSQAFLAGSSIPVINSSAPNFTPVAPSNEPELGKVGQGGSYDSVHGSFAYIDTLKGQTLAVTEQYIPLGYSSSQQAAMTLAKSLGASEIIHGNFGVGYIKTDPQTQDQTVIVTVKGLLIVLQSSYAHQDSDWVNYIDNLR